ncbi:MAG: putative bacterial extracellular solute-binding protein, partial [Chlamydiia bacterium]|nr:putative bacterial extracellular solute-binding protein [Chlamydiia bacterium]
PYTSLKDMNGKELGFERGYIWALQIKDSTSSIFRPYDDVTSAIDDLIASHLDGVIVDALVGYRLASGLYRGSLRAAGPPIIPLGIRLIVKKGKNEELVTLFNQGLAELKKSGLYEKVLRYWGLFDVENPKSALSESPTTF